MSVSGENGGRPTISDNVCALQDQVARLTELVEHLIGVWDGASPVMSLGLDRPASMNAELTCANDEAPRARDRDFLRVPRPPLPDPKMVRRILRQRRLRDRYFEPDLFADPAWDILLDLAAARAEHRRVSVTSLCSAAAVAPTTALRWIAQMEAMGILCSVPDEEDKRRRYVSLSDSAAGSMARYFDEIGRDAARMV